jgi:hypothetical protein
MRNPDRIKRILAKLDLAWSAAPDLRLGQLCHCIVGKYHPRDKELTFNLEDSEFETALDHWNDSTPQYVRPPKGYLTYATVIDEGFLKPTTTEGQKQTVTISGGF